jgi:serine/threonine protein kinase
VQELLDCTLHSYLQKFGFPDTVQTRKLLYQLLMGLRYLHRKNIMHRDIKLENILIRGISKENITPVIVDFGLADY